MHFDVRRGGAAKRSATELVTTLTAHANSVYDPADDFLWTNIRGAIIAIGPGALSSSDVVLAWDENGVGLQVVDEGLNSPPGTAFDVYLNNVTDPILDLDVTSSHDTLIVANRLLSGDTFLQDAWTYDESYNYLNQGDAGSSAVEATGGSTLQVVSQFSDLADLNPVQGEVIQVDFDQNLDPAGIYMFYTGPQHALYEKGFFPQHDDWYRVPKEGQTDSGYEWSKMPHKIVFDEANNRVVIQACHWRFRVTGDQGTVKEMPWTKSIYHIQSVEFHQGRLMLISEAHVTGSRDDDFFNLWVENVNAVAPNDRISSDITQPVIGRLLRCASVGQGLFMVAEHAQLDYSSGNEPLSNVNGVSNIVMDLPSLDRKPVTSATSVVMADAYLDLHQFSWQMQEFGPSLLYTSMLTAHEQNLLANLTIKSMALVNGNLFLNMVNDDEANITEAEPVALYVHSSFIVSGQMIQSAWSKFEMIEEAVFTQSWGNNIRIISRNTGSDASFTLLHYQHREPRIPPGMLYQPRMDRLEIVDFSDMSYDAAADETTVPHTGREGNLDKSFVVTRNASGTHEFLKVKRLDTNGDPVFQGDISDIDSDDQPTVSQYLGFIFDTEMVLSELYPQLTSAGLQTQSLTVFHFETTDYHLEFIPYLNGQVFKDYFQSHRVGVASVGQPSFETRYKEIQCQFDPREATLTLKSSTPGQCAWMALEYQLLPQGRGKT